MTKKSRKGSEEEQEPVTIGASNIRYEENDHHYIKAFLMDASENINQWGVHPSSLDKHINSFIGKPLVLTADFDHPMPQEDDDDNNPYNMIKIHDVVDHWLAYQEAFRIGNIIDITRKDDIYYAIIEVTDPTAKDAFKNNDIPLFVSPAIAQLDPNEDPTNISLWTGIHLALVSNPAYTIKKALVTGQCHENGDNKNETGKCLLQLRQASVINKDSNQRTLIGCGFCRGKVLAKYAEIYKHWNTNHWVPVRTTTNVEDFVNSSLEFSESQSKVSTMPTATVDTNNNTNNNANGNTNNNNNNSNNNNEEAFLKQKQETLLNKVSQDVNPSSTPHHGKNIDPETGQPYKGGSETISLTADEFGIKMAGMEECVQIFTQNGVAPDQSVQICKLAAKALMENQQESPEGGGGRNTGNGPGISGQFGSTQQIADYEKEIAKQEVKIGQLMDELKTYKKGDKTDAQRIAELEDTVSNLNRTLKEKELENYLVTKIADEEQRVKKIKRFADLNLTLEDLKEIYETNTDPKVVNNNNNSTKKTASVIQNETSPITPKVKLQVASTNEQNQSQDTNEIKERNLRISSLLSKRGLE